MDFRSRRVPQGAADRRSTTIDRRRQPRSGSPGRRASDFTAAAALTVALWGLSGQPAAQARQSASQAVRFGVDAASVSKAIDLGVPAAYGSVWAGAWNQKYGWRGVETSLRAARAAGVLPVVQWWYWGDDISPSCVEQGCKDRYHGVQKDRATWIRLSNELADLMAEVGAGSGGLVVLETEFNKNGMERHEPFDADLATQAEIFHRRGFRVIVGFGNWGRESWKRFDRAVAAADLIGAQVLFSSVRDETKYLSGADMLVEAARHNQAVFGKPTFVTDFAFSSYPTPVYERYQDTVVRDIFARVGELREAGVEGMIWRMLLDDPKFDTANYHGQAERHWGLLRADGSQKPAFQPFVNGVLAEARRTEAPVAELARARR